MKLNTKNFRIGLYLLLIMVSYPVLAYLLSLRSICMDLNDIPFRYARQFECSEYLNYSWITIVQVVALFIGFIFGWAFIPDKHKCLSIRIKMKLENKGIYIGSIFFQILILCYFSYNFYSSFDAYNDSLTTLTRVMSSSKILDILVLFSAAASIINLQKRRMFTLAIIVNVLIALEVAWFEGSRASLIFPSVYLFFGISNKKIFVSISSFLFVWWLLLLTMVARRINDKSLISFLDTSASVLSQFVTGELVLGSLSYIIHFSAVHLVYAYVYGTGVFRWNDFWYSITPIPSFMHWLEVDPSLWRVDRYRPMGGMAETLTLSLPLFFCFCAFFGVLVARISKVPRNEFRFISFGILLISFMVSFQYGLRQAQWLIFLTLIVVFVSRLKIHNSSEVGFIKK